MGRIACIDYGLARLGVAISDERKIISSSVGVIHAQKTSKETAKCIVEALLPFSLDEIVIGFPLHMNGKRGFLADEVMHFISLLEQDFSCPIVPWDERLTTVLAERTLKEGKMSRKKRTKVIDAVTAIIILQSYLESKNLAHNI